VRDDVFTERIITGDLLRTHLKNSILVQDRGGPEL